MEKFLLNFVNSREKFRQYFECREIRCGFYCFDDGRALSIPIVMALNLKEILDWCPERGYQYFYEPQFNA